MPSTIGEPLRAATSVPGSSAQSTHDAVGAVDVAQRRGDRLLEVALVQLADQVRQHLGVGLGVKDVAAGEQRLLDARWRSR